MGAVKIAASILAACACLAYGAAQAGALTFTPPIHYRVGGQPGALVNGDLNADGLPDLVAPGAEGDSLAILLAAGNGRFAVPVLVPIGQQLDAVTLGDLDGDGALDIVATASESYDASVLVLLGRGDGTFVLQGMYPIDLPAQDVAVGDVTGDGHADVVAGAYGGPHVLAGDGTGGLLSPVLVQTDGWCMSVVLEDFDRDGHLDMAATRYEWDEFDGFAVLLSDGAGGFLPPRDYRGSLEMSRLATCDLNYDGIPDLLSLEHQEGSAELHGFLGDGLGILIPALGMSVDGWTDADLGGQNAPFALGDIDHRNGMDVVTAGIKFGPDGTHEHGQKLFYILYGQGDGVWFTRGTMAAGRDPAEIVLDDFNADGKDDLATADWEEGSVSVRIKGTLPTLLGVSPGSGKAGAVVTLTGRHFLKYRRTGEVRFGGVPATDYVSWSNTAIRVRVPAGAPKRLVNVTVTSIIGKSKARQFVCR
jgi:hypothetical protein